MRRRRALAPIAPLALGIVLLAGCNAGDDKTEDSNDGKDRAPAATEATTPAGSQLLTAEEGGVRFAVPEDWTALDPSDLTSAPDDPKVKAYAESLNLAPEQLAQVIGQVDVVAVGADGETINAVKVPGAAEIPTESNLRTQFSTFNVEVRSVEDVDTPLGPGRLAAYTLPEGTPNRSGAGLFLKVDGSVVNITATVADAARAQELIEAVIDSLSRS